MARRRAQRLAQLESLDGWDGSADKEERAIHARAERNYVNAEDAYQQAVSTYTAEELAALCPPIEKGKAA